MIITNRKNNKIFYKDLELTKAISLQGSADSDGYLIEGVFFSKEQIQNLTSITDIIKDTLDLMESVNNAIPTMTPYPTFTAEKQAIIDAIDSLEYK